MLRRVLLSVLAVVAATALALGLPLGVVTWHLVGDRLDADLTARLESVDAALAADVSQAVDDRRLTLAVPAGGLLSVRRPGHAPIVLGDTGLVGGYTREVALTQGGTAELEVPMSELSAPRRSALLWVAGAVALSLLVGAAVAVVLARRLSSPLRSVADRAAALGAGDFRVASRRFGIAELDRVADVLDAAARDIAALLGRERDLAGDISHQLRTRLTGIRLLLEELDTVPSVRDDADSAAAVRAGLEQTDQLVAVVDALLAAARSRRAATVSAVDLGRETAALAAEWEPRLRRAGRALVVRCPSGAVAEATPMRLREALSSLLDNATRHGAGTVTLSARQDSGLVVLEVADEGAGIPEALVGHVFDRGVSTAASTGIGLGLARALVEADGGRLELRRRAPAVFAVFLPGRIPGPLTDGAPGELAGPVAVVPSPR
ncbi:sensor histidine kinase [Nakamurella endophytica]|uniref:Signal transduction histidine-protein kinase/phosphatase MprB n=1 Tax=Nakamurella endophytica TaxID=1748367 RepID=A0A917SW34_9ACTN|nr:HAMP domain-containing sensor histidine kinase [Nakamurella endophytica]GGM01722.1 two-component sensor histidine kinase [Nakamurella endophytica]